MGWAYRRGFLQQLDRLERKKFLESQKSAAVERVHRLTEIGRLVALGGRDPERTAQRPWDHDWRMILYDIPQKRTAERLRLRRALRQLGFGYLQHSAWITPHPLDEVYSQIKRARVHVESLTFFQGRPCGGESDSEIVQGAWDFEAINAAYELHSHILAERPSVTDSSAEHWRNWFSDERKAWQKAIMLDPLLPSELRPRGYRGRRAWQRRLKTMRSARKFLEQFKLPR